MVIIFPCPATSLGREHMDVKYCAPLRPAFVFLCYAPNSAKLILWLCHIASVGPVMSRIALIVLGRCPDAFISNFSRQLTRFCSRMAVSDCLELRINRSAKSLRARVHNTLSSQQCSMSSQHATNPSCQPTQ